MTFFHDHSIIILVIITIFVGYLITLLFFNNYTNRYFLSGQLIEIIWTVFPAVILIFIAFPSLRLLYLIDEINSPLIRVKIIGHQWYWRYEILRFNEINFDSYINTIDINSFRLLEVDNRLVIPKNFQIRLLVTAADVLHSWTIQRLGVKVDAVPGRLNQINFWNTRRGIFYGQCSEICGANHSFIPITLERINFKNYLKWLSQNNSFNGW